jgi:hypothetical protein
MTAAKRQLMKRGVSAMAVYSIMIFSVDFVVRRMHPEGRMIWLFAALPVVPIVGVALCIGLYLREETDEFHRDMVTRCLLWGLGALVVTLALQFFLGAYGWKGQWSPSVSILTFAVAMAVAKITYRIANRVVDEDVAPAGGQR